MKFFIKWSCLLLDIQYFLILLTLLVHIQTITCVSTNVLCSYNTRKRYVAGEMDCPSPGDRMLSHNNVPWGTHKRAWNTIPSELIVESSYTAGLGVFSKTFIPRYTWLGEYEGQVIQLNSTNNTDYAFESLCHKRKQYYIDARNIRTCNWARWLNCPDMPYEENVVLRHCYGRIYLMASNDIIPGQELLVYYGHEKAEKIGINTVPFYFRVMRMVASPGDEDGVMTMSWGET